MAKNVKIALCGVRGHIEKFGKMINSYPESETIAVWDPDLKTAQTVADAVGNCAAYTDYDELLKLPELSGVVITYHNYMHKELVLKAAAAGKNIFLEKPLCTNLEDAYELRDAIRNSGVKFYLTDPFVNSTTVYLRDFIQSGKIGDIQTVRVRRTHAENAYKGYDEDYYAFDGKVQCGGHVCDTAGHPMHVMHYILGKPQSLYAKLVYGSEAARKQNYEQFEIIMMDYPNEVTGIIETGQISANYTNCIEVCGSKGVIVQEGIDNHSFSIRYRLSEATEEDVKNGTLRKALMKGEWVELQAEELPKDPSDHVNYWVRMQAYDMPNEQVGIDPDSLHGMNVDSAVDLVSMIDAIYRSSSEKRCVAVR